MKKTAFTYKKPSLQKKTSVYHIEICLLTVSYMKCQKLSRMGGPAARRSVCSSDLQLPGLGDQSRAPARSRRKKSRMPWKMGEEGSYRMFQVSVIKEITRTNTLKQFSCKKTETKEQPLISWAPKTCQIKDNMQTKVPLQKIF